MKKGLRINIIITISALLLSISHICFPNIKIDSITLGLFIVASLPWLAPIFRSVELPGGMKFELQDFRDIEEKANKAGMIESIENNNDYNFQIIARDDPKLALASLRIELEDKLRKLATQNDIDMDNKGLFQIMRVLSAHDLITYDEKSVYDDTIGILNSAVHSAQQTFDYSNVSSALDVGTKLLNNLDKRLNVKSY